MSNRFDYVELMGDLRNQLDALIQSSLKTFMHRFDSKEAHEMILHNMVVSSFQFLHEHSHNTKEAVGLFCELLTELSEHVLSLENKKQSCN